MFKTKIKVRYSETDQMGIVHHSRYFPWFEVGRTEFFASIGMSYSELEKSGIWFPLISCGCTFKDSAKYEDELYICVKIADFSAVRCRFEYEIYHAETNKLIAKGYTDHAFTTPELRPVNLKKLNKDLFDKLLELSGENL